MGWKITSFARTAALLAGVVAIGACASPEGSAVDPPDSQGVQGVAATDDRDAIDEPAIDPEAARHLQRAGAFLRELDAYSFHARLRWSDVILDDVKVHFGGTLDASVRRPNHLHVDYVTDRDHKSIWFDGEHLTFLSADHDVFGRLHRPGSSDDVLSYARDEHGVSLPLTNLLLSDPVTDMSDRLKRGYVLGVAWIDGVPCHHLLFIEEDRHWQVWIDTGEVPIPRAVAITYVELVGQPEFVALLSDWELDAAFDDQTFVPAIPESAIEIEWLTEEAPRAD